MCPSLFSHHLQPEWKRESEENEIRAGPRIWLLHSGVGIKVIKGNNESQSQKRKEGVEWLLHTQLLRAVEPGYFLHLCSNLPCLSFCPCSSVELPQFLLDPLLAVSSPQGTFCQIRIDKAHCWSICTLFHFYFFPIQILLTCSRHWD